MHKRLLGGICLLLSCAPVAPAQDVTWRAANSAPAAGATVTLGQPSRLGADGSPETAPPVLRGQIAEAPTTPPPPFPGGAPGVVGVPSSTDIYNRGMPNNDSDLGSFWTRFGDKMKRCWDDVTGGAAGAFQGGSGRQPFQSDHAFDYFSSPTTNPYFFEDPRALTEIRPVFIWQHTPNNNPVWQGGNDFDYSFRGSIAVTENVSFVISRLGFTTIAPRGGAPNINENTGFSEFLFGPKITFLRDESTGTVAAFGVTFDVPTGSGAVLQNTGHTQIDPYFSIAQNFGKSEYGSFNFMNTTGYTFRTDNTRTEAFYSSFHLDYEIGKRFWPFLEMNWRLYTRSGGSNDFGFEGSDLANFGAERIAGENDLTLALGTRIKLNTFIYWGIAAEFNVLPNGSGQHMDEFRLTTDLIFRY